MIRLHRTAASWTLALGLLLLPTADLARNEAQPNSETALGAGTYKTLCASCHGKSGKGDGVLASQLGTPPSDLTTLSKRNGGRFPFDRVYGVIDGRHPVKAHGAMPAWGDALRESSGGDDQAKVKERITQLTQFLASIQTKSVGARNGSR